MMIAYSLNQVWILQNEFHWELSSLAVSQGFSVSVITNIHMCKRQLMKHNAFEIPHRNTQTWVLKQNGAAALTLTMCGIILYVPRSEVMLYDTSRLSHHIPFPFKPSHLQNPCHHASRSHTPQRCAAKSRRLLLSPSPSQTEWGKFTLAFSFFSRWSVRQLLWWWDTKTALAANAHMSGKIIEFVFASVCVCV